MKEKTSTRNRGAEGTSISTAKATPTTRDRNRRLESEEYDRFTLSKPRFLSLPVSLQIYRSKSAKFQLCITARRIIIFRRTAPGHICFFGFCLFLNPDAEIMLNLLFNTLLTITPHKKKKKKKKKEQRMNF